MCVYYVCIQLYPCFDRVVPLHFSHHTRRTRRGGVLSSLLHSASLDEARCSAITLVRRRLSAASLNIGIRKRSGVQGGLLKIPGCVGGYLLVFRLVYDERV